MRKGTGRPLLTDQWRETFRYLVQDEQAWISLQRPADGQHLLLSTRKCAGRLATALAKSRELPFVAP